MRLAFVWGESHGLLRRVRRCLLRGESLTNSCSPESAFPQVCKLSGQLAILDGGVTLYANARESPSTVSRMPSKREEYGNVNMWVFPTLCHEPNLPQRGYLIKWSAICGSTSPRQLDGFCLAYRRNRINSLDHSAEPKNLNIIRDRSGSAMGISI